MAYVTTTICTKCGYTCQQGVGYDYNAMTYVCSKCLTEERMIYLEGLKALSLEDRISRIEQWIYDYRPAREVRF